MGNAERFQLEHDHLQAQWNKLHKKLAFLEKKRITETQAAAVFQLDEEIAALKAQKETLEEQLRRLETRLPEKPPAVRVPAPQTPQSGPIVHKMCNRDNQENDFLQFFKLKLKGCPRQPQFYFLHGDDGECHESFINRLEKTHIKKYAEHKYGAQYADVYVKTVSWPTRADVQTRQEDLTSNFMRTFEHLEATPKNLANALSQLMAFQKHPLVIISHNIYTAQWDARNEQCLCWYIKDCWANLECHDDTPQFLIFLNIIYPGANQCLWRQRIFFWKDHPKKQIIKRLGQIHTSSGDPDPCQLIEELRPVKREEVQEWFSKFNIYEDEWRRSEKLKAIFEEYRQPFAQKRMADVERHLKMIVAEYLQERSELT